MTVDRQPVTSYGQDFARDGFVLLESWVGPSELELLRLNIDAQLLTPCMSSCSRPNNVLLPLRWTDMAVRNILASERRVQAIRDAVCTSDLRWISGYFSIKQAHSGPLWWHQDWWCWDHPVSFRRPAPQISVLCYLSDTDWERGALRLLPGSHVQSSAIHACLPRVHKATASAVIEPDNPALNDHPEQVTLEATAGDAVIIDYRLLHGTHANTSDRRRDCVILNFAPSWRDLPDEIRAHLISHSSLPGPREIPPSGPSWESTLLPRYDGLRRDLCLNRTAPAEFTILD